MRYFVAELYYHLGGHKCSSKGKVTILMYHRVLTIDEVKGHLIQPGMYVLDSTFEKHIRFLKEHYRILSFTELLEYLDTNKIDKDQAYCVITFDDGWRDNYVNAFPILRENGIPATIFLATSFVASDRCFWSENIGYLIEKFDYSKLTEEKRDALVQASGELGLDADLLIHALKESSHGLKLLAYDRIIESLKEYSAESIEKFIESIGNILKLKPSARRMMLNWDEIREMSTNNTSFGSHGCSHSLLTLLSDNEIKNEISDSLDIVQTAGINSIAVFCYPNGNYNDIIAGMVESAGYKASVTTKFGYANSFSNQYKLNRVSIHDDVTKTVPLFALHISGILRSKSFSVEKSVSK